MSEQDSINTGNLLPSSEADRFGRSVRNRSARDHEQDFLKWFESALAHGKDSAHDSRSRQQASAPEMLEHPAPPALAGQAPVDMALFNQGATVNINHENSETASGYRSPVVGNGAPVINTTAVAESAASRARLNTVPAKTDVTTPANVDWKFPEFLKPANVHLVQSAAGIVVVIRDAGLDPARYREVVQFFRNAFAANGHMLARVTINGNTVYEASPERLVDAASEQQQNGLNKIY